MKPFFTSFVSLALVACSTGGVPMAPEKSPHFDAVSAKLQLGGTVYAYADIDGDAERATDFLLTLLRDLPHLMPRQGPTGLTASKLVRILGLHDLRAIGLSSYQKESSYHNRTFIHHAGVREGLLKTFGGEPASFELLSIAPQHADLVWEQQLDVGAIVDIVRSLGNLGVGMAPEELERALHGRFLGLDISLGAVLYGLNTTAGLILAVDERSTLRIPGESFSFPYTDFLFRIDGLSDLADAIAKRAAFDPLIALERTDEWITVRPAIALPPPWNAYEPSIIKEVATGRMYIVSSSSFLRTCLATTKGIGQLPAFENAFEGLPSMGNALMYMSPRLTRAAHGVLDRVIATTGSTVTTSIVRFFLPDVGFPVGWVASNTDDGMLVTSNTPSSHKTTLLTLGYAALLPGLAVVGSSMLADL